MNNYEKGNQIGEFVKEKIRAKVMGLVFLLQEEDLLYIDYKSCRLILLLEGDKVFHVKKLVDPWATGWITVADIELFKKEGYQYHAFLNGSAAFIKEVEEEELPVLVTTESIYEVVMSRKTMAMRNTLAFYLQDYFLSQEESKATGNPTLDVKWLLRSIADDCAAIMEADKTNVQCTENGEAVNVCIDIFKKEEKYRLYLMVDQKFMAVYYFALEDNKWVKRLLPNKMEDVSHLFRVTVK